MLYTKIVKFQFLAISLFSLCILGVAAVCTADSSVEARMREKMNYLFSKGARPHQTTKAVTTPKETKKEKKPVSTQNPKSEKTRKMMGTISSTQKGATPEKKIESTSTPTKKRTTRRRGFN